MARAIALAAAAGLMTVGLVRGTYAAGGSDSSCYALMADAFASGRLQPSSALAPRVPWPAAARTFTPGGFVPSPTGATAFAPICAPGFSLLLAPFMTLGGRDALFFATPLAGAVLVYAAFAAARHLGGPIAGAMAAVLIAVSPPVLYQIVQPMNDMATTALWMGAYAALLSRRWSLAGTSCGLALLVRPNLLPLGAAVGLFMIANSRSRAPVVRFALAALPFGALVLWLNAVLYGTPLRTGYGQPSDLFSPSHMPTNLRYLRWLVETHTPFPLLAIAAPFATVPERRRDGLLAIALILLVFVIYLAYTPFDDWSYLRFLLPAIALMIVLASVVFVRILEHVIPLRVRVALIAAATLLLAIFCVRVASDGQAFQLQALEQRYRSAGLVVRDQLPADAVVLSVWDSGAVRFHGRKEALSWEALDPAWLDRALAWLAQHGHEPYIMVESWEEPGFRTRFGGNSEIGKLDWPPKYEVDRKVRIYDPRDRQRYQRGDRVDTDFLWPLRR